MSDREAVAAARQVALAYLRTPAGREEAERNNDDWCWGDLPSAAELPVDALAAAGLTSIDWVVSFDALVSHDENLYEDVRDEMEGK